MSVKVGRVIWISGPTASGKTTLAKRLMKRIDAVHLEGKEIRKSPLGKGLTWTPEDVSKNVDIAACVARAMSQEGINVIVSMVSPDGSDRNRAFKRIGRPRVFPISLFGDPARLAERDTDGVYKGDFENVAGVDAPYDIQPAMVMFDTTGGAGWNSNDMVEMVMDLLERPSTLLIGRYAPYHQGHEAMVVQALMPKATDETLKGLERFNCGALNRVVIAVRDTPEDIDLFPQSVRIEALQRHFREWPDVQVIGIPDIDCVAHGRKVGYRVIEVSEGVEQVSGTEARKMMAKPYNSATDWEGYIPGREMVEVYDEFLQMKVMKDANNHYKR